MLSTCLLANCDRANSYSITLPWSTNSITTTICISRTISPLRATLANIISTTGLTTTIAGKIAWNSAGCTYWITSIWDNDRYCYRVQLNKKGWIEIFNCRIGLIRLLKMTIISKNTYLTSSMNVRCYVSASGWGNATIDEWLVWFLYVWFL